MSSDVLRNFTPPKAPSLGGLIGALVGVIADLMAGPEVREQMALVVQRLDVARNDTIASTVQLHSLDPALEQLAEKARLEDLPTYERLEAIHLDMLSRAYETRDWGNEILKRDERSMKRPLVRDLTAATRRLLDAQLEHIAVLERQLETIEDIGDGIRADRNLATGTVVEHDEVRRRLNLS